MFFWNSLAFSMMIALQILILNDDLKLTFRVQKTHPIITLWINEGRKRKEWEGEWRKETTFSTVKPSNANDGGQREQDVLCQWDGIQCGWRVGRRHSMVSSEAGKVIAPHNPCKGWGLPLESSVRLLLSFRKESDLMRYIIFKDHLGCSMENRFQ